MSEQHPVIAGLHWILANRKNQDGKRFNATSLARAAGISRSHIGGILDERQSPNIERDTAMKIARAANVRVDWLLTGRLPREPFEEDENARAPLRLVREYEPDDPYPTRAQVILMARGRGVPVHVLDSLRIEQYAEGKQGDPGFDHWTGRLEVLLRGERKIESVLRAIDEDIEAEHEKAGPKRRK